MKWKAGQAEFGCQVTLGFQKAQKRSRERTIVPRMVCGRVKFLKASPGERPWAGRLRCWEEVCVSFSVEL
jgi:hypothetical protein